MCAKSLQLSPTVCDPIDCSPQYSLVHGDCPGKNPGMDCHALLQGIFLTQRSNSHALHYRGFFTTEPRGKTIYQGSLRIWICSTHRSPSVCQRLPNSGSPRKIWTSHQSDMANLQGLCIDILLGCSLLFHIRKSHPKETSCALTHGVFPAVSVNKGCHCHQRLQPPWMMSW